jgi:hypothetical protein
MSSSTGTIEAGAQLSETYDILVIIRDEGQRLLAKKTFYSKKRMWKYLNENSSFLFSGSVITITFNRIGKEIQPSSCPLPENKNS